MHGLVCMLSAYVPNITGPRLSKIRHLAGLQLATLGGPHPNLPKYCFVLVTSHSACASQSVRPHTYLACVGDSWPTEPTAAPVDRTSRDIFFFFLGRFLFTLRQKKIYGVNISILDNRGEYTSRPLHHLPHMS